MWELIGPFETGCCEKMPACWSGRNESPMAPPTSNSFESIMMAYE